MCIHYRQLKLEATRDAFPLPRVDESSEALAGAKYFTTLDLAHGYYQCAIDARDVPDSFLDRVEWTVRVDKGPNGTL